jgi:ABC-2 type transport system ATP-binding protein
MLEVRNIAFSYGFKDVLKDVTFAAKPGEIVCIVGNNGVGKTTLLKILATIAAPDAGIVRMEGQDALKFPLKFRRNLGYLQESPSLYEDMTVKSYLKYRAMLKGEPEKRIRRRIQEALGTCGIKAVTDQTVARLSFGVKKRVALADAILLRPRLVLLDDVFAGFDRSMRHDAREIIKAVSAFSCVILTGHEISDLAKIASRFLVLSDGRISASVETAGLSEAEIIGRVDNALKGGAL